MYCVSCGKQIDDDSRFCTFCGAKIDNSTQNMASDRIPSFNALDAGDPQFMAPESEITKGCKIWFWFVLIVNAISAMASVALMSYFSTAGIIGLISGIVMCAGAAIILFKKKKVGFYMIIAMAVIVLIFNLASGTHAAISIISAIGNPIISYYFVKKNANIIQ